MPADRQRLSAGEVAQLDAFAREQLAFSDAIDLCLRSANERREGIKGILFGEKAAQSAEDYRTELVDDQRKALHHARQEFSKDELARWIFVLAMERATSPAEVVRAVVRRKLFVF